MKVEINQLNQSLAEIANNVGAFVQDDAIVLPASIGEGYYKQYLFSDRLKMVIVNCSFKEEFQLIRNPLHTEKHTLVLRFHDVFTDDGGPKTERTIPPSVYITTEGVASEVTFPPGQKIQNIIISIEAEYLIELLQGGRKLENETLTGLLSKKHPFWFEELMTPKIYAIVSDMEKVREMDPALHRFYYQLQALELVNLFLNEFLKRVSVTYNPVNKKDIQIVYAIREQILTDLSAIPSLSELALKYAISESKMKKVFKQVFGQSIYQYFQYFRIHKAATLMREQGYSVSEAGYHTGFTNLSHFSRLFERHLGQKPKKYSMLFRKG